MNTHLTVPVFCAILQAELLLELFLGLRADGGSDNGVIPQQHEHRDALHTEGLRQLRLSTLTLPTAISGWAAAISSTTGDTMRHGPHHSAQKSSSTGLSARATSSS